MDIEPPSLLLINALSFPQILSLVILFVLLFCSALISGAEVAFFSLTSTDFDASNGNEPPKKMELVQRLLSKPKKLLATILVANNFINIAIVLLFDSLTSFLFSSIDTVLWGFLNVRFIVEVGVVTFLILLFGEILPKIYASRNKVSFASTMAMPLRFLDVVFTPLSMPMRAITIFMQERFGKKTSNISVDQLSQALELTNEADTTKEEQKILQGIVTFGNTDTKQVMKPRMDIFALNEEQSYKDIMPEILEKVFWAIK